MAGGSPSGGGQTVANPTVKTSVLLPLPAGLVGPAEQLQTDLAAAMLDAGGLVEQIPSADVAAINDDVIAVERAAVVLANNSDSTVASPALDAYFTAAAIAGIISEPKATPRKMVMINPNLFMLAVQYLNDYARWQEIAAASGMNPPDPQPIGQFTVIIPAS
jgi:hypothetical protein